MANNAYSIPMHGNALTPSSGSMYDKSASSSGRLTGLGQSESSGDNNISGSPDGDNPSNRPTPNSSSSDQRVNMTAGGIEGSGQNSFEVGPATAQQNINPRGDTDENANYFNSTSAFDIRTGLTPNPRFSIPDTPGADFGMSTGWGDVQGQAGMTPGAEGVLRSLMNMGPMDAMDLSSWDAAN